MSTLTTLQPQMGKEAITYNEVSAHIPTPNNNFAKVKEGVLSSIDGVLGTMTACVGLSYDLFGFVGRAMDNFSGKLLGANDTTDIPKIQSLSSTIKP